MSDFMLKVRSPLDGIELTYGDVAIREITGRDIVSIAIPLGGTETLSKAVISAYQTELPAVGRCASSHVDNAHFLGMAPDQYFIVFDRLESESTDKITSKLGETGYFTDQSDSWVMMRIGGPKSRTALERICPIDLHPTVFPEESVTRTLMEHLSTIILSEGNDHYLLLSARSSAGSFLQVLQKSVENVL
ncbi:MAG: sarcosine oxidase subunit gamma family protein [Alphaproteobacteria bacterium]